MFLLVPSRSNFKRDSCWFSVKTLDYIITGKHSLSYRTCVKLVVEARSPSKPHLIALLGATNTSVRGARTKIIQIGLPGVHRPGLAYPSPPSFCPSFSPLCLMPHNPLRHRAPTPHCGNNDVPFTLLVVVGFPPPVPVVSSSERCPFQL